MNTPSASSLRSAPVAVSSGGAREPCASPRTSSTAVLVWISIFGVLVRPVDHDLACPERRRAGGAGGPSSREPGQVHRLLERGVAAADDRDLLVPEEEPVARRARRHAAAAQARLALEPEPQRRRAGRHDDRLGAVLGAARPEPERPLGESTRSMSTSTICVPNRSAWPRNAAIRSGPWMPSGKPG